jgi:ketosteroid isomerase-like protein
MTDLDVLTEWVHGYLRAWNSNDPADIEALFTDDAEYYPAPFQAPWQGAAEIVRQWLERRDEPGTATFAWNPVVATGDIAVVQGTTVYPDRTYSNLWVIRFGAQRRCREFTEWWMAH